jgi:hypothetical protein
MIAENKLKFIYNTTSILDIYENTVSAAYYHYQNMHQNKHRVFNIWLDYNWFLKKPPIKILMMIVLRLTYKLVFVYMVKIVLQQKAVLLKVTLPLTSIDIVKFLLS